MSTFTLSSPGDSLPQSQNLNLLPFSLPRTVTSAPISAFFQPRTLNGANVATFRGRKVVGQVVQVPRGYAGVVLRASGGGAAASGVKRSAAMLTPAPSTVSVAEARAAGRTRGAGQVAAARPRTRAAPRRAVKRVKLEDDEDEEEDDDAEVVKPIARRTRGASAAVDAKMKVKTEVEADEEAEEEDNAPTLAPAPSAPVPANADPYYEDEYANADETDNGSSATSARVLVPTAMWSSFTLWTPDAPLAGFDAEEMSRRAEEVTAESNDADDAGKAQTRRGWWRRGGAGEGGDEFVRALGEWVGLCEVIHEPCYPLDDEDDE